MTTTNRWAISALLLTTIGFSCLAEASSVSGRGVWETTLLARDFDGDKNTIEGYYDTAQDITWLTTDDSQSHGRKHFLNNFLPGGEHWSEARHAPIAKGAWSFTTPPGYQGWSRRLGEETRWTTVYEGNAGTSVVPVPAAVWLFGSGLLGLIGIARRKKLA